MRPKGGRVTPFRRRQDEVALRLSEGVEAKRIDELRAELTFACGHTMTFEREDGRPLRASDIGDLMVQTECGDHHD